MEKKILQHTKGRYFVDVGITVDEWKEMLADAKIFYPLAMEMVMFWYIEDGHKATSKEVMRKYEKYMSYKSSPFNGIVKGLAKGVLKHLDRFEVLQSNGSKGNSFWCIPFEGWHEGYDESKAFVWKLRDELVQAIDETVKQAEIDSVFSKRKSIYANEGSFSPSDYRDDFQTCGEINDSEGKRTVYYTARYERSRKNRDRAIKEFMNSHGKRLFCEACGFDFEAEYGEKGRGFIEVHHNKPLYSLNEETVITPKTDLNCLCSNCHRMIHKIKPNTKGKVILSVDDLKKLINKVKNNNGGTQNGKA